MAKEIPILFSTPMVQAILDGRKTMTRRVVKPQPDPEGSVSFMPNPPLYWKGEWYPWKWDTSEGESIAKHCPYGEPGDILWVRESWLFVMRDHAHDLLEGRRENSQYVFKTQFHDDWMKYAKEKYGYKWKPSIHMPKEACRIWLEVTNVRVERLKDISPSDVLDEGIENGKSNKAMGRRWENMQSMAFEELWTKINGPQSWVSNPWVWVVSFKVLSTTGRPSSLTKPADDFWPMKYQEGDNQPVA